MNTTETLIDTIDYSMNHLADGEAALQAAQRSQDKFADSADLLAERVTDIGVIAHHVADIATKVGAYVESANGSIIAAGSNLQLAAAGTESPALQSALSHAVTARLEAGGPQEAARGCIDHAGTRLQTIGNLVGALMREVTALQQESGTTHAHIARATSATQDAKQAGQTYLHTVFGDPL